MENIIGSFITLLPKKQSPETVNDFRPISLTNNSLEFLTKLVVNKFQAIISKCIHDNQYGFIKSRPIQVVWPGVLSIYSSVSNHG